MQKVQWDYTRLAKFYDKRAEYAEEAVQTFLNAAHPKRVADIGAGTGKLTCQLLQKGLTVFAVEPNAEMKKFGTQNTQDYSNVTWSEGTGENTGLPDHCVHAVTFGSSFNVMDRLNALREVKRITVTGGYLCCLWNHRNLQDSFQQKIEDIIKRYIPDYDYGTRREDQTEFLQKSGLLRSVHYIEGDLTHVCSAEDLVEAWRSHATVERQAGPHFSKIITEIAQLAFPLGQISVPYTTRLWYGQLK